MSIENQRLAILNGYGMTLLDIDTQCFYYQKDATRNAEAFCRDSLQTIRDIFAKLEDCLDQKDIGDTVAQRAVLLQRLGGQHLRSINRLAVSRNIIL